ncbi:MAG: hypothetical protein QG632_76 [Candidatus Dependentiae bacterium]|nr:hypothetical protein [Candidatus Dependentiae bacterium]
MHNETREEDVYMNTKKKKNLPIGISSFETLISEDCLYIDKTELIYRLITTTKRYFLARPHRFGKSLLISTLKEIFSGNKELFKNLWIGQEKHYKWKEHPVITIDFSMIAHKNAGLLESGLAAELDIIGQNFGIKLFKTKGITEKTKFLVRSLAEKRGRIVILIDEYDYALVNHINNPELAQQNRDILRSFYSCFKGLDEHLHFVFFTGVSKFSKTSVFSGLNNLKDISLTPAFATLCGYTEDEILQNFPAYIADFATVSNRSAEEIMNEMRTWYNGYRFSRAEAKVYNPFSVFHYLDEQHCGNYWFASGTPTFLVDLVKSNLPIFSEVDHCWVDDSTLDSFDIGTLPLTTLFYQTGYLTIEDFQPESNLYKLTYPNEEVRQSLNKYLISMMLNIKNAETATVATRLKQVLQRGDIPQFCETLQILLAHIPCQIHVQEEAYYHSLFHMICMMLGIDVASEVSTSKGRVDLALQTPAAIYLFELKLGESPSKAITQIKERRYYEKYLSQKKPIYLIGMSFDYQDKKLAYIWELLT